MITYRWTGLDNGRQLSQDTTTCMWGEEEGGQGSSALQQLVRLTPSSELPTVDWREREGEGERKREREREREGEGEGEREREREREGEWEKERERKGVEHMIVERRSRAHLV